MKRAVGVFICILFGSCQWGNESDQPGISTETTVAVQTPTGLIPMGLGNTWIYELSGDNWSAYDTVVITDSVTWKDETVWVFSHTTGQREDYFVRNDSVFRLRAEYVYSESVMEELAYVHCPDTLVWNNTEKISACMDNFDGWENSILISTVTFRGRTLELLKEGIGIVKIYPSSSNDGGCNLSGNVVKTLVSSKIGDHWYYW